MLRENELATLLAALRHWQAEVLARPDLPGTFPHFHEHPPLAPDEIDALCERLNAGEPFSPCACEDLAGFFCSGVPGILARVERGRLAPGAAVERCDACQRYSSDEAALAELKRRGLA